MTRGASRRKRHSSPRVLSRWNGIASVHVEKKSDEWGVGGGGETIKGGGGGITIDAYTILDLLVRSFRLRPSRPCSHVKCTYVRYSV